MKDYILFPTILAIVCASLLILTFASCGTEKVHIEGIAGEKGDKGDQGIPGMNDLDEGHLTIIPIPNKGECVNLTPIIWVENEWGHADYYNNDKCDHGPSPLSEYCNNVPESNKHCWVDRLLFFTVGKHAEMKVHMLDFNG